jgi:hypothetical protein
MEEHRRSGFAGPRGTALFRCAGVLPCGALVLRGLIGWPGN